MRRMLEFPADRTIERKLAKSRESVATKGVRSLNDLSAAEERFAGKSLNKTLLAERFGIDGPSVYFEGLCSTGLERNELHKEVVSPTFTSCPSSSLRSLCANLKSSGLDTTFVHEIRFEILRFDSVSDCFFLINSGPRLELAVPSRRFAPSSRSFPTPPPPPEPVFLQIYEGGINGKVFQ